MTILDQADIKQRLYQNLPAEWFPDLADAPNLTGILDMLASVWTSHQVLERTLQFDVSSSILLIDGVFSIPSGALVLGDGVLDNPTVIRSSTQTISNVVYQTVTLTAPQLLPAGTRLTFDLPDLENDGIAECIAYAQKQTRLQTTSDMWLDLFGQDFFGSRLQRHVHETDNSYRRRLLLNVLAPRISRCAVTCNVTNLTGHKPTIIEVRNTNDCGSYTNLRNISWGGLAYNQSGAYGSMELPFQFFIRCTRPLGEGIPIVNGYSMSNGGYGTYPQPFGYIGTFPPDYGTGEYVQLSDIENNIAVTDADIYATVADSVAAGVTAWANISSDIQSEIRSTGMLDISFYLDMTTLANAAINPGQMMVSGTIKLLANATVVFNSFNAAATPFRMSSVATINNPNALTALASIHIDASVSLNTVFIVSVASFSIKSAVTLTSDNTHLSNSSFSIVPAVTVASQAFIFSTATIRIQPAVNMASLYGISIGKISANVYGVNGTLFVDYISTDFKVGSSLLTPAGSRLGQTLLLGTTKLGIDYGY